ncbi:hypothetical protein BH24ACT26_BH24ACT26_13900 [soil metagenome]
MRVTVVCFGLMREYLPGSSTGNRAEVEIAEEAQVTDVIDALGAPRRLVFALLVDGRQVAPDEQLHDGAEITLMPPFTGG